jgi:MFS family permease
MLKNFIVLLLAQVFVCFGGLTLPPLIPFLQSELTLNYTQVGSIMTFLYLGAMAVSLPAGWLTDKLGVKKMVLLCQVIMGCFVVLYSLVGNYIMAILLAFAMGLAYGMVNPPTTIGIMVLVRKETRGTAMSIKQTGVPFGGAFAAGLLPPLALRFSWEFSFICAGVIIILSGLLSQILYQQSQEKSIAFDYNPEGRPQGIVGRTYWDKNIIFLGIGGAFCSLVQISLVTYIILYLKEVKKFDLILAAFGLTLGDCQVFS